MKQNKRRIPALLLVLLLLGSLAAPALAAEGDTVHLRTAQDLVTLSQNCSLDSWSVGKTVYLDADIDLTGSDFQPIPIFCGTFDGQGHTISGFSLTGSGSQRGFFRYVQTGATIQDLTVQGSVAPSEQKDSIGGLVGVNSGQILNCSFQGNVKGGTHVGGIVGQNEPTGQLINCSYSGTLLGEHYVGGIVGQNEGSVIRCQNQGDVNITEVKTTVAIHEVDLTTIRSTENAPACTDIGGIAGASSGILQSCTNTGDVGYEHVGYNVGGIAGRQSGWLDSCVNTGTVRGRKDVGGICGQMEPRLTLLFDQSSLDDLWEELDTLQALMDQAISHAQGSSDSISAQMTGITDSADEVRHAASDLSQAMTEWADGNIETINDVSARISWAMDRLDPIADSVDAALEGVESSAGLMGDALDELDRMGALSGQALDALRLGLDRVSSAMGGATGDIQAALDELTASFGALSDAFGDLWAALGSIQEPEEDQTPDPGQTGGDTGSELPEAGQDEGPSDQDAADSTDASEDGLVLPDWNEDEVDWTQVWAALEEMRSAADQIEAALGTLGSAVGGTGAATGDLLLDSLHAIASAAEHVNTGFQQLDQAAGHMEDALDHLDDAVSHGQSASGLLQEAAEALGDACGQLRQAGETFDRVMSELAAKPDISFTPVGEAVSQKGDALDSAMGSLSSAIQGLNETMSASSELLLSDLRAINQQFGRVIDVLRQWADGEEAEESTNEEDLLEDVSDQATETDEDAGRITNGTNTGAVEGDVNVAGIVGSMAIEYDYDPEDDLTSSGDRSLDFHYQAAALTEGCVNNGSVTGKKDYVGGIVGRMDLGTVSQCESYAPVESTGGDYVGGIAGAAWSTIRSCWARCALSGKDYIGGVAGLGKTVTDCRSLVEIDEGSAYLGAVLGDRTESSDVSGNLFTHDTLAGIGGVSYLGKAEPVSFEVLSQGAPAAFTQFRLTFRADGQVIKTVDFSYGDALSPLPDIPEKEGYSARWPDLDYSRLTFSRTLDAEYTAYTTALTALGAPPQIVAEGTFSSESSLCASQTEDVWTDTQGGSHTGAIYTITIADPILPVDSYQLQYKLSDGCSSGTVWVKSGDRWTRQDAVVDGSYLVFPVEGDSVTFTVEETDAHGGAWLLAAAGIAAAAALLILLRKHGASSKRHHKPT